MASISCTEFDCVDGTCRQRCADACGGAGEISAFQCGAGILCNCFDPYNADVVIWACVISSLYLIVCATAMYKRWRANRAVERQPILAGALATE